MDTIFIVEDDIALREELTRLLTLQGYAPRCCERFDQAAQEALACQACCVVLDLRLPGADGLTICRDIRASSAVPIIMLTSSTSEFDEVMALGLGANDFVTKPYRPAVLLARIQAVLRNVGAGNQAGNTLECEGVRLDCDRATISYEGASTELSRNEMRILALLLRNAGRIVSRQDIMCDLWESDEFVDDNTLTVNVNRLRRALERIGVPPEFIRTSRGIGYSAGDTERAS